MRAFTTTATSVSHTHIAAVHSDTAHALLLLALRLLRHAHSSEGAPDTACHPDVGAAMNNVARVLVDARRFAAARSMLDQSLQLHQRALELAKVADSVGMAAALDIQGSIHAELGKPQEVH